LKPGSDVHVGDRAKGECRESARMILGAETM
jgi:hypothetical protein